MKPQRSLKARALQLLAQREHSRTELRRKLLAHARAQEAAARDAAAGEVGTQNAVSQDTHPASIDPDVVDAACAGAAARHAAASDAGTGPETNGAAAVTTTRGAATAGTRSSALAPAVRVATAGARRAADPAGAESPAQVPAVSASERVDAVLDWLEAHNYLSMQRFVESRVHARAARFGDLRIRLELAQHDAALPAEAVQALRHSELDRAREVWSRKFAVPGSSMPREFDAAARAKQARFLTGRGFSADSVRQVLREAARAGANRLPAGADDEGD